MDTADKGSLESKGRVWETGSESDRRDHPQNHTRRSPDRNRQMLQDPPPPYPPQYLEGLRLFNEQDFFECHDVLEELWSDIVGDQRQFYQGLIQVAVALFHFGNGNLGGARKLFHSSQGYLEQYPSPYMGLDLGSLCNDLQTCFQELLDAGNRYPTDLVINESLIPRVTIPTT